MVECIFLFHERLHKSLQSPLLSQSWEDTGCQAEPCFVLAKGLRLLSVALGQPPESLQPQNIQQVSVSWIRQGLP